jgi:hypothetical protein
MQTKNLRTAMFALFTLAVSVGTLRAVPVSFPAQGDDNTTSLGQFNILVNPAFQPLMAGYPGYSASAHVLTSPTLYDPGTVIGRSSPLLDGSASDAAGVPVGSVGTIVGDSSLSVVPGGLGPVNTREVHTQLRSLNMTGGGAAVRAGIAAPTAPISVGEVESLSGASGIPALDFPAKSFFDVFVQVDLPSGGAFPGATGMSNSMPLLVQNTNVTSFPPQVVYVHGMSTAVPIKFSTTNPGFWNAGDTFGLLQLAGHGVFDTNKGTTITAATAQLQNTLAATPPAPVEPQYSSWATGLTVASNSMIFANRGNDVTTSLGTFRLAVNPAFQPYMTGYPGWDSTTKRLTSPLLFDPSTTIGRSSPLTNGSSADTTGVQVGLPGSTIVASSNLTLIPPMFNGPNGTREVHTEIRSLNLAASGAAVRAGTAATGIPKSFGEVQSLSGNSGDPYWDFPAKSFFDIFVDVDIPAGGSFPGATVSNSVPLIVQQNNLTAFPPKVIYVHGNSTAVPVLFTTDVPSIGAHAGDTFGILLLAGHGIGYNLSNSNDVAQFQTNISQMVEQPVTPQYNTWAPNLNTNLPANYVNVFCSSNITVTSSMPTTVFFTVTASGGCGPLSVIANPPSGSNFPVGTTTVTTAASDTCGNSNTCSFTVTVVPPTYPPIVLNCPSNITVTASFSTPVFFTVTASGGCSPPPFVSANPPSGSTFPIGTTTVFTTASDSCGNSTNCSFTVTVSLPTNPPIVLNCPSNITTTTATGSSGAVVFFTVTASGGCSPPPFVTANPPSGSTFPVGTTTVFTTASDTCGNSTNCSFTVTVNSATNPPIVLNCPSNITTTATGSSGALVFFTVTASGGCSPPPFVSANPPSGSTFPVGTTTVFTTASDSCGNSTNCSFAVTVNPTTPLVNEYFTPSNSLPPPNMVYISPAQWHALFASGIVIRDVRHRFFTHNFTPPPLGTTSNETFSSELDYNLSTDGGATFHPATGTANVTVQVTHSQDSGGTSTFNTEMTQLDLNSGGLMLRESPTLQSTGQTTIRPVPGGYMISSFFDIFTEVSLDGGATWTPSSGPGHMEMRPDPLQVPATGEPTALLPAPNDDYVSPAQWHALYANGIVIKNVKHKLFTSSLLPPSSGNTNNESFNSILDLDISTDGGYTFQSVRVPNAPVQITVGNSSSSSDNALYDTEMTSLNLTTSVNGTSVMVRESPTLPSRGMTEIDAQSDGTYRISSFFDIFTELSLDGGITWSPATNGPVRMQLTPQAPEVPAPNGNLPVTNTPYVSPAQWHALYATGIILTNVSHSKFTTSSPPPASGKVGTETFGSTVTGQISVNGGASFAPFSVSNATVAVTLTSRSNLDNGNTRFFDTEMTSLNLSGGTLPSGVMVRESPTKQSLGRTSVRSDGTGYHISSFFDIFTEVSLDNGATWSPSTSQPATMAPSTNTTPCVLSITCPSSITVTSVGPAVVFYTVTASDSCGGIPSIISTPPSGSSFPLGTTTVTSTASDANGSTSCSFTVTVVKPNCVLSITCPPNITVTSSVPATVFFTVTASDSCGGIPTVNAVPASGSTFPIGTTTVTSTASDTNGSTSCSFTVTVVKPNCVLSITCPSSITVTSVGPAVVFYTVTASDSCGGIPSIISTPPSGSSFPLGTTTVTSTASDANGSTSCSFTVTVLDRQRVFPSGGKLPPTNSIYISPAQWHAAYNGGIYISNVTHRAFTANFPPPAAGTSSNETFGSKVDFMYSTDGGRTFQKYTGNATTSVTVSNAGTSGSGTSYQTRMTQLDLNGGSMPSNMKLRIDPGTRSTGQTLITPSTGGNYKISSFFDIFVDLSLDGGTTWMTPTSSGHMELHIDPANPPTIVTQPKISGSQLNFNVPTIVGLRYTVQYASSVIGPWTTLTVISGNGQSLQVNGSFPSDPLHEFYRVVIDEDPNQ